jgi:hypothetical protein
LHVRAMELHELNRVLSNAGSVSNEFLHKRMAKEITLLLDELNLGTLGRFRCRGATGGSYASDHASTRSTGTRSARLTRHQPCAAEETARLHEWRLFI